MKEVSKRFINLHQHYNPLQCLQAPMVRHSLKVLSNEIDLTGKSVVSYTYKWIWLEVVSFATYIFMWHSV
jgi:hypothetical protein